MEDLEKIKLGDTNSQFVEKLNSNFDDIKDTIDDLKTSDLENDGDGTSPFATQDYVGTYGGKIDKIKVDGVEQSIVNKEVDLSVYTKAISDSKYATKTELASTNANVTAAQEDISELESGKQDKLSNQTAYTSKGSATKVAQITTNSLGQVTNIEEVDITQPTVNNNTITIQKNGTAVDSFTLNQGTDKTINITVPTQASDVNALPDTTKYGASLSLTINTSTYVITGQLKDQDGNNLGTAQTIDLPLESVVVSGRYDSATKKVILTLKDGSEIEFSVADLISGLQSEITSSNKLGSDLVDDSNGSNKFVSASEKSQITTNQNDISTINTTLSGYGDIVTHDADEFATPSDIPTTLAELTEDTTHRVVTDTEKSTWNAKQSALPTTSTAGQVLKSTATEGTTEWGSIDAPSNMVTTDTAQTISSQKTFSSTQRMADGTKFIFGSGSSGQISGYNYGSRNESLIVDGRSLLVLRNSASGQYGSVTGALEINSRNRTADWYNYIRPYPDNKYDIGTPSDGMFRNFYLNGNISDGTNEITVAQIYGKQDAITSSNKLSASLVDGLSDVATSGSYNDLSDTPTIPTVNDGSLTIQKNGTTVATFTANDSDNVTANIEVPSVENNVTSTSTTNALSANMGKELQTQITNLQGIGRFLAIWNATTGLPTSNPTTLPYTYKTGDYYRVGTVAIGGNTHSISMSGTDYSSNAYTVSFSIIDDTSTSYSSVQEIINALYNAGHIAHSGTCQATGTITDHETSEVRTLGYVASDGTTAILLQDPTTSAIGSVLSGATATITDTVTANPSTNYMPSGSSYTGTASSTVYSGTDLTIGSVFYYDGTTWQLQASGGGGTVQDVQVNSVSKLSGGIANIQLSDFDITATSTELNYVDGVTSNIQDQLDGKQASGNYMTTDTAQTGISGNKTFTRTTKLSFEDSYSGTNYIQGYDTGLRLVSAQLCLNSTDAIKILISSASKYLINSGSITPYTTGGASLGSYSKNWNNLFLSGNISDGTNTISVADIVAKQDAIPNYLKNASVSGDTLTITKQDDSTLTFSGGSGSALEVYIGTESDNTAPATLKEGGLFFKLAGTNYTTLTVSDTGSYTLNLYKEDTEETNIYLNDTLVSTSTTSGSQDIPITTTSTNSVIKIENSGNWYFDSYALGSQSNQAKITAVDFTKENKMTQLGRACLSYATNLSQAIVLPSSVTALAYGCLSGSGITSLTIPNSVITVGEASCYNCSSLTVVNMGNSVTSIGKYAFEETSLSSITLPNTLTTIESYAFMDTELTTLTIPSSVTNIGYEIVGRYNKSSSALTTLNVYTISSTTRATSTSYSWVYGCSSGLTIHAPSTLNATTSQTAFGIYWNYISSTTKATTVYDL